MLILALALAAAPITLDVDATDIGRRIVHAKLSIPAAPGPLTLVYPKWIPGEHMPSGPILGLVGLRMSAGGKAVPWTRDSVEMYAFHVDVPAGASAVDVALDFVSPTSGGGFSGSAVATSNLGVVSFNQVLLYPQGAKSDDVTVQARLAVPAGWHIATALPPTSKGALTFAPVSLTMLVDSPVLVARHLAQFPIGPPEGPPHFLDAAAETEALLAAPPDLVVAWRQLVAEAGALFGSRHYAHYDFLLTLSDKLEHFGLEHHESSDDRVPERLLVDDEKRALWDFILPHEFVHSWNGKFRRPAGLATGDYETPMKDDLLWVYEGLTHYLGFVLTARSGTGTDEQVREYIAYTAAALDMQAGRAWRPLGDTATFAPDLYMAPEEWWFLRRGTDFYDEGTLLWLDVDTRIRALTKGKRSLDDFCRAFHGGPGGKPEVKPYTIDDVVAALNAVAPYDWRAFWNEKLTSTAPRAPLDGLLASGWKIAFVDEQPAIQKALDGDRKTVDLSFSLGIVLKDEDATIIDVNPGSPAYKAGLGPGMKLLGVNGRKYSKEALHDGIKTGALELLVENADFYQVARVDYKDGERYPVLVRDPAKPDVLARIFAPRTPHAPPPKPKPKP